MKSNLHDLGKHSIKHLVWVLLFATVGATLLFATRAATPFASREPETASLLTGSASIVSDASAAGGASVLFAATPPTSALSVNASRVVKPFNREMKGMALANWTFTRGWNKPFVGQIQGLPQAIQAVDPGLIRYAGGLWANYVGFDRTKTQQVAYTDWTYNGKTYSFNYGTDELKDLDAFAKTINAQVMIQVNVSQNEPAMWADLVRYAKEQNLTNITYYEFANELDLETFTNGGAKLDPGVYAARVAAYQQAMVAADNRVKFVGGVPAEATDIMYSGYAGGQGNGNRVSSYITQSLAAARGAGRDLDSVSYHWYQNGGTLTEMQQWSFGIPSTSDDWWRTQYSREWSGLGAPWIRTQALSSYPTTRIGISELGLHSGVGLAINGNHIAALWYSDVLGRLAYSGVDWVTQWDSYAAQSEPFSLIYPSSDQTTTPTLHLRPAYYAYVMYNKYFGDQMVETATFDPSKISIWASKDSDDPGKLKLRITNLSGAPLNTPIAISGFTPTSATAYVMASTNPTDMTDASATSAAPTTINGVKINASNVSGSLQSITGQSVGVAGSNLNFTFPAYSSTAIIVTGN